MKIGLTGATGFLGNYIAKELLSRGHGVVAWRNPTSAESLLSESVTWIEGRLGDREASIELARKSDAIVHAGLMRSGDSLMDWPDDPVEYFRTNVQGSLELIQAAAANDIKRFVFVSSGAVHQRVSPDRVLDESHPLWPETLYGAYKASVETLVHAYGFSGNLDCCTVRPTAIYGLADPLERSKWFPMIADIVAGKPVEATGGSKSVHAADVTRAILLLLESDHVIAGETFNCCDRLISNFDVASIAKRLAGSESILTGSIKPPGNLIDTKKIERLGMQFGGATLLESTIQALVDGVSERRANRMWPSHPIFR